MNILIASGFFESELPSYREYSYSKELASLGHKVTLMAGDQSQIWSSSRVKLPSTNPGRFDETFVETTGVRLLRRHVFFRYSDLVLYAPVVSAIREADVVHVIEFRQGVTVLVALLAKLMGKPVVYDHEQRGDRSAKWYSRVDSLVRRALIWLGSFTVSEVRHTVLANRDHFLKNAARPAPTTFAPLGTDPGRFFFDAAERDACRAELGIAPSERLAVMSGKMHGAKRVPEVIRACRAQGVRLVLVGTIAEDVRAEIESLGPGSEVVIDQVSADRLRRIYAAADVGVFTTFTLSYWEALATGLPLIVPSSEFTQVMLKDEQLAYLFGAKEMFAVPDEVYKDNVSIIDHIENSLKISSETRVLARGSSKRYSAGEQVRLLEATYKDLMSSREIS